MEETKKFKKLEDGKLQIVVNGSSKLILPYEKQQIEIGTFEQVTTQIVDQDKIPVLMSFVENQYESTKGNLENLNKQISELKDFNIEIPEELVAKCQDAYKKGTKAFKTKMESLQQILINITKRKQMLQQKEYLEKQMEIITKDYDELKKI